MMTLLKRAEAESAKTTHLVNLSPLPLLLSGLRAQGRDGLLLDSGSGQPVLHCLLYQHVLSPLPAHPQPALWDYGHVYGPNMSCVPDLESQDIHQLIN